MALAKTRRVKARRRLVPYRITPDPLPFLAAVGVLERVSARPALEPWLCEILGERYLAMRTRRMTIQEVRELWRPHMQPGEKLSDLLIAMREE